MITLVTFPPSFGAPSASNFCTKAIYLLNMSGHDWTRHDVSDPRKYPKGKLPAIEVGGATIGDSDNIRAWLEAQGTDFDAGLGSEDKATSRAFIRMAEDHMYFHLVLDRWFDPEAWPIIRDTYFAFMPRPIRLLVTRGLRKSLKHGMHAQGLGRFTPEERMARIEHDFVAIAERVSNRAFLFGDRPTAADASVAPILSSMMETPAKTALAERVRNDAVLRAYAARVSAACG